MADAQPEVNRLGEVIYALLLTRTEGKAVIVVHVAGRGARAEVWRLLRGEYSES